MEPEVNGLDLMRLERKPKRGDLIGMDLIRLESKQNSGDMIRAKLIRYDQIRFESKKNR